MLPVVVATGLSIKVSVPTSGASELLGTAASTRRGPAAKNFWMAGRYSCGTVKSTWMGVTSLITTIGTSATFTRFPGLTITEPVRPSMGEYILQYSTFNCAVLTAASSAATDASAASAALLEVSASDGDTTPSASSFEKRWAWARLFAATALSRKSVALACASAASYGLGSIVNSIWPL